MRRVAQIMPKAINKQVLRIADAMGALKRWDEVVGPALATRSWPDRYDRGVVWVAVEGSSWAQELRLMKDLILERLRSYPGAGTLFSDVRFGVRKLPPRAANEADETEVAGNELSISDIAKRRLENWPRES